MKGLPRLLSRVVLAVLAAGGLGLWSLAGPAVARAQEPVKLTAPSSETREYSALVGTDPGNQGGITRDPTNCSSATYCDTIPIELSVSDSLKSSDTEDYFLRLKVEWDNSAGNNVNLYLYDAPHEGAAPIASSATANMPETINLYRPEKAQYLLVVHNTAAVNTGYKLTAAITVEPFGGAPDFGGVNENPGGNRPPPPSSDSDDDFDFDDGSDDTFSASEPTTDMTLPPPRPLADVTDDESLSALARSRGGYESALSAPNVTLQENEGPPPAPVSGATVAILGGLLPASIVGGGVFWLRRKGGTASPGF